MSSILFPDVFLGFGMPGGTEWIVLLVLGLLIFGRRLPEVGRSVGRSIVEFKKGIKGIEDEIEDEATKPSSPPEKIADQSQQGQISGAAVGRETSNPYEAVEQPRNES